MNRKSKNNLKNEAKSGSFNSSSAVKAASITPDYMREVLSALADGERRVDDSLSDAEIVEMTCQDADARASWQCMHVTRDVMQADYHSALDPEFASRLSAKIELEETPRQSSVVSFQRARQGFPKGQQYGQQQKPRQPQKFDQNTPMAIWKPVAGLGLAASLAGAVFLAPQLWNSSKGVSNGADSNSANTRQVVLNESARNASPFMRVSNAGTRWRSDTPLPRNRQIESRLNELLTNHFEDANTGRVHGVLAHSRVVSYDTIPADNTGF